MGRSDCRSGCTTCATHATLLLADGVPVKVVSERLGHASATITLTVYQHVHPGMGRKLPTALVPAGGLSGNEASRGYQGILVGPDMRTPGAPDLREHRGEAVSEGDTLHTHTYLTTMGRCQGLSRAGSRHGPERVPEPRAARRRPIPPESTGSGQFPSPEVARLGVATAR